MSHRKHDDHKTTDYQALYNNIIAISSGAEDVLLDNNTRQKREVIRVLIEEEAQKKSPIDLLMFFVNLNASQAQQRVDSAEQRVDSAEQRADSAEQRADLADQRAYSLSLLRCLSLGNDHFKLHCTGTDSSHLNTNHIQATGTTEVFTLCRVEKTCHTMAEIKENQQEQSNKGKTTLTLEERLLEEVGMSLKLGTNSPGATSFSNEADIQFMVSCILQDAVSICNILLRENHEFGHLTVRTEASLFTNRLDHLVVYASGQETPVVSIEDKKPHDEATTSAKVDGQALDQMIDSMLLAWTNSAVGVLTTIEKTKVVWMGSTATEIVTTNSFLSEESLTMASSCLRQTHGNAAARRDCEMESPNKELNRGNYPTDIREGALQLVDTNNSKHSRKGKKAKLAPRRVMAMSQVFDPKDLIHVFCNVIVAGLKVQATQKNESLDMLPVNSVVKKECALVFTKGTKPPQMDDLNTIIKGRASKKWIFPSLWKSQLFYVVGLVGTGSTSKALRAVVNDHECVIKMYVLEFDEEGKKITDFETNAKKSVEKEAEMYGKLYPSLKEHVWTEKLCNRWCLILPFLTPLSDKQRKEKETESKIRSTLERVAEKGYCFAQTDQRWRHVGLFGNDIVIFDLADLIARQDVTAAVAAGNHVKYLMDRLPRMPPTQC